MPEVSVLGPLRVRDGAGDEIEVPSGRERALLALLVIRRGHVVSVDAMLAALWGESPPPTAAKAVQGYISHLRRILPAGADGDGPIVTRAPGYLLRPDALAVDADVFATLAIEGRHALDEGDAEGAVRALEEGLALWRGPALGDVAYEDFAQDEVRRLEELRLGAREDRAEALLGVGRTSGLAAELTGLVAANPLRERLRALAMHALYRDGRQADALDLYERGRRALAADLGVDPGPQLTAMHRAILTQDPSLGAVPAEPAVTAPASPEEVPAAVGPAGPDEASPAPPERRGRRRLLAIAAGVVAGLAIGGAALAVILGGDDPGVTVTPPALVAIDVKTNRVVASVAVGSRPISVAADATGAWVGDARDGTVTRVDASAKHVGRVTGLGAPALDLTLGAGGLWVATGGFGDVVELDPAIGRVTRTVHLGTAGELTLPTVSAVEASGGVVWVGTLGGVTRIAAATGRVGSHTDLDGGSAQRIAAGGDSVWATTSSRRAERVERATGNVTAEFHNGDFVLPVAVDGRGGAWLASAGDGQVWKVDALTGSTLLSAQAGNGALGIAVSGNDVWVASWADGTVTRLDAATGKEVAVIDVGGPPQDVAVAGGLVWVPVLPPDAP